MAAKRERLVAMQRDDGTPVQIGDWWWVENGRVHFRTYRDLTSLHLAASVPNRLYGAEINHRGEAI